jgi:hypothetical protein
MGVDGETVRRMAERWGHHAEMREQAKMATVEAGDVADPGPDGPDALMVAVDGAMVQFREENAWREVKGGGCVPMTLTSAAESSVEGERMQPPDFGVGWEPRPAFWFRVYAHAVQIGWDARPCRLIALLGDGADWMGRDGAQSLGGSPPNGDRNRRY